MALSTCLIAPFSLVVNTRWHDATMATSIQLLRGLFVTHTFVFMGASMRDPDMQLLLEDDAYRFEGSRPHYMVMPEKSARAGTLRVMEDTMNLKALTYDPAEHHKALADSVAAPTTLGVRCCPANTEPSTAYSIFAPNCSRKTRSPLGVIITARVPSIRRIQPSAKL
jgi:hypothetical protein